MRSVEKETFIINDPFGIKMLAWLRFGFSGFILKPLCSCSIEVKTTTHYFRRRHSCNAHGATLKSDLENVSN